MSHTPASPPWFRPTIAAMHGYVPGEQPRDPQLVKLNTNENPYPPSPAVGQALATLAWQRLNRYPDPVANEVRAAAAAAFGLSPAEVMATNGSDEALTLVVRAFVDQGGTLACPDPTYSLYPVLAEIQGATCRRIPLDGDFELPADFETACAGASLVFIARPNAPTGNNFPLARVRRLAAGLQGILLVDEAYADFADDHCLSLVREFPHVLVSRTLSKSYSLAGLRLGFLAGNPALIAGLLKVKDSYNLDLLTQVLGAAALRDQEHMRATVGRLRQARATLTADLTRLGFSVLPSQANFVLVRPPIPAQAYYEGLRRHQVIVRYFPGPRTGDFVRITIGTPAEMAALIAATRALLAAPA